MIRISAEDLRQLREHVEQMSLSAFWLETYALGLSERAKRMKQRLLDLETVALKEPEK